MNHKLLKRISVINMIALVVACLVMGILFKGIPETFLSDSSYSRSIFRDAFDRHSVQDELKTESTKLLRAIDYTQSQSRGLFRIVLLFNVFVIGILIANVLTMRRLKKLLAIENDAQQIVGREAR
jgi:hypothetical protein